MGKKKIQTKNRWLDYLNDNKIFLTTNRELFYHQVRDIDNIDVYLDNVSGAIYLSEHIDNTSSYIDGNFRAVFNDKYGNSVYEKNDDLDRRLKRFGHMCAGKDVLDFGCGAGDFLLSNKAIANSLVGIELNKNYQIRLKKEGITVFDKLDNIHNNTIDVIFAFHVFEHLDDPISFLINSMLSLRKNGKLIIEIPHGNDLLLKQYPTDEFKRFSLWSQHLILHTHKSLEILMKISNIKNYKIEGVQRYGVSNHLNWLFNKKPGGHKTSRANFETNNLKSSYEDYLKQQDSTDTLYCTIEKS
tara:strand:+ start:24769 stop:25668 length:900 start_codon:yes stop_codon:yes gene_type:complete